MCVYVARSRDAGVVRRERTAAAPAQLCTSPDGVVAPRARVHYILILLLTSFTLRFLPFAFACVYVMSVKYHH